MTEKDQNKSYIKRLINGDISLAITFWIWFVFITLIISTFSELEFTNADHTNKDKSDLYFALFIYFFTLLYTIFIFIAVIRSANNYKKSKIYSFLAKILVTLNLFFCLYSTIEIIKIYFLEDYAIYSEISSYKSQLPIDIDSYTQLYDIEKDEKNIFYVYKLKNLNIKNNFQFNKKRFSKQIQNSVCEDEGTLGLLKKDYILKYTYLDMNNQEITNITTKKESCGKHIYDLDILKVILEQERQG